MRLSDVGRAALVAGLAGTLLGGCSGAHSQASSGAAFTPVASSAAGRTPAKFFTGTLARETKPSTPDTRKSWIASDISKSRRLLFVSDSGLWDVYIYSLPSLKLKAVLTGFKDPQGECSDASGDIWVANFGSRQVIELSRTGTVLRKIKDDDGFPVSCAVNTTTGDLAVTNLYGLEGEDSMGSIDIYAGARGKPVEYTDPDMFYYYNDGYDIKGNLFIDGQDESKGFLLSELPKGAKAAHTVTVSGGVIYFPGLVQWDTQAKALAVGDQQCNGTFGACVYLLSASRSKAEISTTVGLNAYGGSFICDLIQGVISSNGKAIYGSDYTPLECNASTSYTYSWDFPAGGNPTKANDIVDRGPTGAAISVK